MDPIDETSVEHLARLADLRLTQERRAAVAAQFRDLVDAANELNRKMAAPHLRHVVPGVRFAHPDPGEGPSS
jgi:Asp-tRNA(Asn)/Glu-tRNA(Gln) amidotransferase C subunit